MTPLRLGFVPLTDCALLAVADAKGLFRRNGLPVELSREPSWANIRDKVAVGALDGAHMLASMPLAAAAGVEPVARPLVAACSLGLNGNAVTVSTDLWERMYAADPVSDTRRPRDAAALRQAIDSDRLALRSPLRFAVVYRYSMHNYELRYWLAAAGIDPDRDVRITVVPPPRIVDALAVGAIDGFCAGEPWNSLAVTRGVGRIATTKFEIWNNSPEKVFAVSEAFAERHPNLLQAILQSLIDAALWCDAAENREELARMLARHRFVGAPESVMTASLQGYLGTAGAGATIATPDLHVFQRYAANFPWTSHAIWILAQMMRWGHITPRIDIAAIARRVFRPDLYRAAASAHGISVPAADMKIEGTHREGWSIDGTAGPVQMGCDQFCDGAVFDPEQVESYLDGAAARAAHAAAPTPDRLDS